MKALAAGLAVALVALGIMGGQLWRELRSERANNRELAARIDTGAAAPTPGHEASPQPAVEPASSVTPDIASPPAAAELAAQPPPDLLESTRQLLATPEGQDFQRGLMRRMLAQQYPDLEAALGLTPEQVEALFDLIATHQASASQDQLAMLGLTGDPAERQESFRRMSAKEQAHEREMAELLGPKYPQWQQYEQAASNRQREDMLRQQSQQLRAVVSSERNPLTDAQFNSLSAALKAEEQVIDRESGGQSMQQQLDGVAERTRRMAAVAADHLNPEQLAQYEAHLQQQAATMRAMMGVIGAASSANGASSPPSAPAGN
jgi:hypothetical protein